MDQRIEKAFEFAHETTRQLITLSTAVIALTITFATDIAGEGSANAIGFLYVAWLGYVVSILSGIIAMLGLTGNLERAQQGTPSIYSRNIAVPSAIQVVAFVVATLLSVIYGVLST
jgi:hypothetical protein